MALEKWPNQKRYYERLGKDGRRKKYVAWKYGEKAVRLEATATQCAICSGPIDSKAIDHCHECDEVRGILCRKCNAAIGLLNDSPELLKAALAYLDTHKCAKEMKDGTA